MPGSRYQHDSEWSTRTSSSSDEESITSISESLTRLRISNGSSSAFGPSKETGESDDEIDSDTVQQTTQEEQHRISHKVLKLRKLLLEAIQCTLTIIWEYNFISLDQDIPTVINRGRDGKRGNSDEGGTRIDLNVKEPWMKLSRCLIALKRSINGSTSPSDIASLAVMRLLWRVMDKYIVPLTEDKVYTKFKIGKNEAKAIPSLLKVWDKMKDQTNLKDSEALENEQQVHSFPNDYEIMLKDGPVIILRLVNFALLGQEKGVLDLSGLQVRNNQEIWESINLIGLCRSLSIDIDQVLIIVLSHNSWSYIPSNLAKDLWRFPKLRRLDISNNPSLQYLPISLLKSSMTRITARQTQLKENTDKSILIKSIDEPISPIVTISKYRRGVSSLSSICTRITYNTLSKLPIHQQLEQLSSLPPHLADLIRSTYICVLCDKSQAQFPGSKRWMEKEVIRAWAVEGKTMPRRLASGQLREVWAASKIVKVKGRVCRYCLDRYLSPSSAYD